MTEDLEQGLIVRLEAVAVDDLERRVYAEELPEGEDTLPALDVAWRSDDSPEPVEQTLSGPDVLERHLLEVTVWADDAVTRSRIGDRVEEALVHWPSEDDYDGPARIEDIENAGYEGGKDEETGQFWRTLRFRVLAQP